MKKCLCVFVAMVMVLCMVACVKGTEIDESEQEESMFVIVEVSNLGKVVYNRKTRVMYISDYYGGFELLVNADGSPMIYEGK